MRAGIIPELGIMDGRIEARPFRIEIREWRRGRGKATGEGWEFRGRRKGSR